MELSFDKLLNWSGLSGAYSSEYQQLLNYATTQGYTLPSSDQKAKQNALIIALKSNGIWDSLDVFYCFANNGSKEFATLNWKDPSTFQCAMVNSPVFTSNVGFKSTGPTQYLDTQYIPNNGTNYTLADASFGTYIVEATAQFNWDCGTRDASASSISYMFAMSGTAYNGTLNSAVSSNGVVATAAGLIHVSRRVGNTIKHFRDGVEFLSQSGAASSRSTQSFYVSGYNNNGVLGVTAQNRNRAMFFAGSSLTGKETSLSTAWTNYLTSL
jgi:hypothetical protein